MPIFMAEKSVGLGCFGIVGVPQTVVDRDGGLQLCERGVLGGAIRFLSISSNNTSMLQLGGFTCA